MQILDSTFTKQHRFARCFYFISEDLPLKNNGRLLNTAWINEGNSTDQLLRGSGEIQGYFGKDTRKTQRILSCLNIRKFITSLTIRLEIYKTASPF